MNAFVTGQTGNASFIKVGHNPLDITVPYFSNYKCAPVKYSVTAAGNFNQYEMLQAAMNYFPSAAFTVEPSLQLSLAGADDFIMGFQIGPPVMSTTLPS